MIIDFQQSPALTRYHLLTQTILPRPIAWVLSGNDDQSLNLAPFSFFNAMCSDPPLLVMSIGKKLDGEIKDTRHNLLSGRDFVVHIASIDHTQALNASAAAMDYGQSEIEVAQLKTVDFPGCSVPRLEVCSVAYHCRLYDHHEIGPNQQAIIYAEVIQLYVGDDIANYDGNRYHIDAEKLNPLSRLGGAQYAELGRLFSVTRPK